MIVGSSHCADGRNNDHSCSSNLPNLELRKILGTSLLRAADRICPCSGVAGAAKTGSWAFIYLAQATLQTLRDLNELALCGCSAKTL